MYAMREDCFSFKQKHISNGEYIMLKHEKLMVLSVFNNAAMQNIAW